MSKYEAGQAPPRLALLDRLLAALNITPLGLGFALSAVDSFENLPRRADDLTLPVLPVFGGEAEAAMGRLLAGLMRSFLDDQGRRVAAAALPEDGVPE